MGESKEDLDRVKPISYIISWFKERVGQPAKTISDRIIVANSTTGSGKSTVMPAEIYLAFKGQIKNVIITQPRVVTAIDIPLTITQVPVYKTKFKLGVNIGYQTGDYSSKPKEGLLFCTVGILLQMLSNSEPEDFCKKWQLIILDEAHDRSISLDLVFFYMKKLISKVSITDYPFVILTSGTMDVDKYLKYFETKTVFDIKGDSYPIATEWSTWTDVNYIDMLCKKIIHVHENEENDRQSCDIVAFLPTKGGITKIKNMLVEYNATRSENKILPLSLDSATFKQVKQEYFRVFNRLEDLDMPDYSRKVILGTNAIETGITLESISYCIDAGLVNVMEYNPALQCSLLTVRPVTKAMSLQRRGRVGRIRPGKFFPLYDEPTFTKFQNIQYPEIIVSDITQSVMKIVDSEGVDCRMLYETLDTLDKLPRISVSNSIAKLRRYGFLDSKGMPISKEVIGIVNKLFTMPFTVVAMMLACMLPENNMHLVEIATIASFISVGKQAICDRKFEQFDIPFGRRDEATQPPANNLRFDHRGYDRLKSKAFIACEYIEWLLFFYRFKRLYRGSTQPVFDEITGIHYDNIHQFCEANHVMLDGLIEASRVRDEIIHALKTSGVGVRIPIGTRDIYTTYVNTLQSPEMLPAFIAKVTGIKKCMYFGMRYSTAHIDKFGNHFVCDNGITFEARSHVRPYAISEWVDDPSHEDGGAMHRTWYSSAEVMFDGVMLQRNARTKKHAAHPMGCISTISGFL
jgi:HrpA-like RNA helicase